MTGFVIARKLGSSVEGFARNSNDPVMRPLFEYPISFELGICANGRRLVPADCFGPSTGSLVRVPWRCRDTATRFQPASPRKPQPVHDVHPHAAVLVTANVEAIFPLHHREFSFSHYSSK